jgi:tellurite resistance protein
MGPQLWSACAMADFQQFRTDAFSTEEALLGLIVGAAAVDGEIHHEEMREIMAVANRTYTLGPVTPDAFHLMKERVFAVLKAEGIAGLFAQSAIAIPQEKREPFFTVACDVLFADGQVTSEETKFMEIMTKVLSIDPARAQSIVAVMAIKNQA